MLIVPHTEAQYLVHFSSKLDTRISSPCFDEYPSNIHPFDANELNVNRACGVANNDRDYLFLGICLRDISGLKLPPLSVQMSCYKLPDNRSKLLSPEETTLAKSFSIHLRC